MSNATIQNREREGNPFVIYGLICPITLEVKYVGQSTDIQRRTRDRTHSRHDAAVREWIDSLGGYLRPYRVILERGVNRVVRVKVNAVRKPGSGRTPSGFTDVWISSCLETKWIKRFRGTILNRRSHQIPSVYEALTNPPLPWEAID